MYDLLAHAMSADRLRAAETARRLAAQRRRSPAGGATPTPPVPDGSRRRELRALLEAAALLDPDDHAAWRRLTRWARSATAALVVDGVLPPHLAVAGDEPPALVTRTLSAAWRRVSSPPACPHTA